MTTTRSDPGSGATIPPVAAGFRNGSPAVGGSRAGTLTFTMRKRFMSYVEPEPTSGCWLWTGSWRTDGYGQFRVREKVHGAHRVSYRMFCGTIPSGLFVCHRCDVPACVNPDHLFLGTHDKNMSDMKSKERGAIGDAHGKAKLNSEDVASIRSQYARHLGNRLSRGFKRVRNRFTQDLAKQYGVSDRTIRDAVSGRTWSYIKQEGENE